MKSTWMVVVIVAASRAAFAQTGPAEPAPDATHGPGFVTIDRQDATSRVGVEASYMFFDSAANESLTPLRFNLYGQYVDHDSGAGGYASLPMSYLNVSQGNQAQSATGLGCLELGGLYVPKVSSSGAGVILHAGLTLPTGSSAQNSGDGAITNIVTSLSRFDDFYLAIPKGWSLRIGISPVYRSGQFFARADLGIDANLSDESSGMTNGKTADSAFRVNFAGGVDLGQVALSAEITNLYDTASSSSNFGSSWIDTGAVAARFMGGQIQPYGAIVFPLDHESHEAFLAKFNLALTFGAAATLD